MFLLKYLSFLAKSTNQHGVHSPFVYDFVTKCLYSKKIIHKNELILPKKSEITLKQYTLLLKNIRYFKAKSAFVDSENLKNKILTTEKTISIETSLSAGNTKKYDIIFLQNISKQQNVNALVNAMYNDSVLIINNLHKEKPSLLWQELVIHPEVTACINSFSQGYVFIRKEQGKELFYIRV